MNKILNNKIINEKITKMRDKNTENDIFLKKLEEISAIMAFNVEDLLDFKIKHVTTPTNHISKGIVMKNNIMLVPILRAGLGMLSGFNFIFKDALIGKIGIERKNKSTELNVYHYDLPETDKNINIFLLDPMLATGNSAIKAIQKLKDENYKNISFIGIIGVEEGIKKINETFPDVNILLATKDEKLNEKKYIVPGLGDAGDRLFGKRRNDE